MDSGFAFLPACDLNDGEICLELERQRPAMPEKGYVPTYQFYICHAVTRQRMGVCDLRVGKNELIYYGGNIGYSVWEQFRGHRYAAKACRLLFLLARRHGMARLIITCNPENTASRRTCEILGGRLLEIADLPEHNDMYQAGERQKCIFEFSL